uniref:(northern house mosquito) hypothetical protein n=1 Tax=Culex pipiens TaxID=7175 RepID=A0A8D8BIP8_CULPI
MSTRYSHCPSSPRGSSSSNNPRPSRSRAAPVASRTRTLRPEFRTQIASTTICRAPAAEVPTVATAAAITPTHPRWTVSKSGLRSRRPAPRTLLKHSSHHPRSRN